jgi:hypothetical protein
MPLLQQIYFDKVNRGSASAQINYTNGVKVDTNCVIRPIFTEFMPVTAKSSPLFVTVSMQ